MKTINKNKTAEAKQETWVMADVASQSSVCADFYLFTNVRGGAK
jgi:hypothetical protein